MYRLVIIILMSVSVIYGTQNVAIKEKLPLALDKLKFDVGLGFVTELCEKIGELCPDAWQNQDFYRCSYGNHFETYPEEAIIMDINIIHEAEQKTVCAFKYNFVTHDLTLEGNPDFLWKIEHEK